MEPHRARERRLQRRERVGGLIGGGPLLALTLTHSVPLSKALPLPGPRSPRLLTGINDLSLQPCGSEVLGTTAGG